MNSRSLLPKVALSPYSQGKPPDACHHLGGAETWETPVCAALAIGRLLVASGVLPDLDKPDKSRPILIPSLMVILYVNFPLLGRG